MVLCCINNMLDGSGEDPGQTHKNWRHLKSSRDWRKCIGVTRLEKTRTGQVSAPDIFPLFSRARKRKERGRATEKRRANHVKRCHLDNIK